MILSEYLKLRGVTQAEFARQSRLSRSYVSRLVSGERVLPRQDVMARIRNASGGAVTESDFYIAAS